MKNLKYKQEVIKYLKKSNANANANDWLLIEPHLLYIEDKQAGRYLEMMKNADYSGGFHSETVATLNSNKEKIFGDRKSLNFVDLGPGYPDKSLPIARWFKNIGSIHYYPVDISSLYLDISVQAMQEFCFKITPIQAKFEDLPQNKNYPKGSDTFVMLGLTFMNFEGRFILDLLKKIAGKDGIVIIASELLSKNLSDILAQYNTPEMINFAFEPLRLIGLGRDQFDYEARFENERVETTFISRKDFILDDKTIKAGDRIITAVSYRYSLDGLKSLIESQFSHHQIFLSERATTAVAVCSK